MFYNNNNNVVNNIKEMECNINIRKLNIDLCLILLREMGSFYIPTPNFI